MALPRGLENGHGVVVDDFRQGFSIEVLFSRLLVGVTLPRKLLNSLESVTFLTILVHNGIEELVGLLSPVKHVLGR
jgi:hypothetical protein